MRTPTKTVKGRIVFRQAGPPTPILALPFELWSRQSVPRRRVGEGRTDGDGRFTVAVDGVHSGDALELRVLEEQRAGDGRRGQGRVSSKWGLVAEGESADVGDVAVAHWPYRLDFATPRAGRVEGKLPQRYSPGFLKILLKAALTGAPDKTWLKARHQVDPARPTPEEIQARQARTLTLRVEEESPGRTRGDAWLGDQLLNGFNVALEVGRDRRDPSRHRARIAWGEVPRPARMFDLADVDVTLEERGGALVPIEIHLKNRRPQPDGAWAIEEHTLRPADDRWEAAKRVVRSTYLLHGALDAHITLTHLQTEMYAVALFRNVRTSPLRELLEPHLREIVAQDHDGDNFAWGYHGILSVQSALTPAYIAARMERQTAHRDWKTFRPRAPLCDGHRYAKAANLYWEVLTRYLEGFFEARRDDIIAAWPQVRAFSDDLVRSSPPFVPEEENGDVAWADTHEHDDPAVPRPPVDGVARAVRAVTTTDAPREGELDDLLQLCRYVLYQSTFNHSWAHDGQYDAGGELTYACFALRNGSLGDERDPKVLPPPDVGIEALCTNTLGTRANYGYLLADEDQDVSPALKAALEERRADFAALGVDVDKIRSRINI